MPCPLGTANLSMSNPKTIYSWSQMLVVKVGEE